MEENNKKEELEINNEEIKQEEKQEVIEVSNEEPAKKVEVKKEETKTETKMPEKDRKGLAIASMVLGIVALVLFCVWYISIPCAILALVFGIISLKSSKRGMAIAGISTGSVGFVLMILLYAFIFFVIGVGTFSGLKDALEYYEDHNYDYNYHYNAYDDYDYKDYYDYNDWL